MDGARSRVKRGRKFEQVLEGARNVFMKDGFEGASVDDIAREAGVSKATLYSYFPDKRLLFLEVATSECRKQAESGPCIQDPDKPAPEVLTAAAERIMGFYLSDFGRSMFRIVVAETDRFPELGQAFWNDGPAKSRAALIHFFTVAVARGELVIEDLDLAADQFTELCKADLHTRKLMGFDTAFSRQELERISHGAVTMFLARYGA